MVMIQKLKASELVPETFVEEFIDISTPYIIGLWSVTIDRSSVHLQESQDKPSSSKSKSSGQILNSVIWDSNLNHLRCNFVGIQVEAHGGANLSEISILPRFLSNCAQKWKMAEKMF